MPQAIAAAAVWVGNVVGSTIGSVLTAAGVSASVALPIAATAANVAFFASELAITVGLQYVVDDIAHQKPAPIGQELNLRVAADVAREMYVGVRATGGSMVARYSRGSNLYNAHFAIQVADHPCVELSKVYGDGRLVQDVPLVHGVRTEITAYSYSGGARVWMTWHDGRPGQTVDSDLVSKSALDPDVVSGQVDGWSSSHYGAGCAWVHVEVQWDSDILTSIPEFLFVLKGAKFYDPRLDTTAGGSGSHRLNDPATWAYTTNAALVINHYLLGYQVENDDLAFGVGLEPDEVPYSLISHLADLCDEDVTTGTSPNVEVIKRYCVNGVISAAQAFEDVLESLQIQMAARIVDLGGRIGILGAEERAAVVSLTDADWASDDSVKFADKLQFSDLYGAISGRFSDPGNLYQPTPYERQTTDYFLLPDGGEATTAQVDMPLEIHPRRAARLASAWISRESLQPRLAGTFATRSLAWKLEAGDWFNMSSDHFGFTDELFEVVDVVKHEDFSVSITARAINPDFLAFSVDDDPDLSIPPAVDPYSLLLDEPTFDVEASSLTAGGVVEPSIEFTLTSDEAIAREIVVEVSKWDGVDLVAPSLPFTFHASQIVSQIRAGILPSTSYKVRAKTRAGLRESPWTAWSAALTTGATYAVGSASSVPWTGVTDPSGTRPDDNADVTGSNVAAGITGQAPAATDSTIAPGATKNIVTRSSSAPSSPVNGDVWVDTSVTPNVIKVRVSGAWQTSSSLGGVFGSTLYEDGSGTLALLAAFKTLLGTSAGFTGQGALATLSSLAYGGAYLTGFGALAAKATIDNATLINSGIITLSRMAAIGDGRNLLLDDFADINAWTPAGGAWTFSTTDTAAMVAMNCLRVAKPAAGNGTTSQAATSLSQVGAYRVQVVPGETIALEVKCYYPASYAGRLRFRYVWYDTAGTQVGSTISVLGTSYLTTANGGTPATETLSSGALVVPAGASTVLLQPFAEYPTAIPSAGQGYYGAPRIYKRPKLGADLYLENGTTQATNILLQTSLGTAAAIAGQGWGATASEQQTSNALVAIEGLNKNPTFQAWTSTLPDGFATSGSPTVTKNTTNKLYGNHSLDVSSAGTNHFLQATSSTEMRQGDLSSYLTIEYEIELVSGDFLGSGIVLRRYHQDTSNYYDWRLNFNTEHPSASAGRYSGAKTFAATNTQGSPSGAPAISPAMFLMNQWTSMSATGNAKQIRWYRVKIRPATQQEIAAALGLTAAGDLARDITSTRRDSSNLLGRTGGGVFTGELAADVTLSHTAAGFTGQGGLATLSFVTIGTNLRLADGVTVATTAAVVTASGTAAGIAGQGGLATANFVLFSSTVRLADGTTVVTDAMVVTSSGISAGITGQGGQATANAQRGSSYSGTPTEGSWWADTSTTPNLLKFYTGGSWNTVASLTAGITATASPSSISSIHTGSSFTSGTITITPAGGTSYTYAVTFVKSGGAGNVTLSATNSNSFTATASLSSGQDVAGGIIVSVFEPSLNASCSIRIPLNFTRTD